MQKLKFLYLATTDTPLDGHAWSSYLKLPADRFEKRIVVFQSTHGLAPSLLSNKWLKKLVNNIIIPFHRWSYAFFFLRTWLSVDKENSGLYCYYQNEFLPDLSSWILRKVKGYRPDVIIICWTPNFLTSKTIRSLHEKTDARIHFTFIDEQHMTGGCHYPSGCEGYKTSCMNCPALKTGKIFAHYSLEHKKKNLKGLPISVSASVYDGKLASESALFRDATIFTGTSIPNVVSFDKMESRKRFGLDCSAYVVFFACSSIHSQRKGATYALKAIYEFKQHCSSLILLLAGLFTAEDQKLFDGIHTVFTGYLGREDMFMAYCASDVFLSSTIADSGPMMVNYAIALGIPVVAFPVGVADTLVKTGKTGYLAEYKNATDLAQGLLYLQSLNEEERNKVRKNCLNAFVNVDTTPWYDKLEQLLKNLNE